LVSLEQNAEGSCEKKKDITFHGRKRKSARQGRLCCWLKETTQLIPSQKRGGGCLLWDVKRFAATAIATGWKKIGMVEKKKADCSTQEASQKKGNTKTLPNTDRAKRQLGG